MPAPMAFSTAAGFRLPSRALAPSTASSRCPLVASASSNKPSSPTSRQNRPLPAPARSVGGAKRIVHVKAPVVDTRVAFADEAHHWITVDSGKVKTFERAAVAQADIVNKVEREKADGSVHHRWVLRKIADPVSGSGEVESVNDRSSYVVMESFKEKGLCQDGGAMQRWLGAIERVAPAVGANVTTTLRYANIYTSKEHDVTFDVNNSIVVMETVVAQDESSKDRLRQELELTAQKAVAGGCCQEFCVIEATCTSTGLFKTIEVYKDTTTLRTHMVDGQDKDFLRRTAPLVAQSKNRTRVAFKPVVFA